MATANVTGDARKVEDALAIAVRHVINGGDASARAWVIDQMVRVLAGDGYAALVAANDAGREFDDPYLWDEGTAP